VGDADVAALGPQQQAAGLREVGAAVAVETRARELQGLGPVLRRHDRRLGDLLGGDQVLVHQQRRDRQNIADVVEAVADVVGREVVGGPQVEAREVTDGVVVLFAVEAAHGHAARVIYFAVRLRDRRVDPADQEVALGGRRLRHPRRRHVAGADVARHLFPHGAAFENRGRVLVAHQRQIGSRAPGAVARHAVPLHQRRDVLLEGDQHWRRGFSRRRRRRVRRGALRAVLRRRGGTDTHERQDRKEQEPFGPGGGRI
jgi:hypothetical protein